MPLQAIVTNVIGGVAVLLLAVICRVMLKVGGDVRRFMREHLWLLATTLWTRDKVLQIMAKLDMTVPDNPPEDLPWNEKRKQ